MKKCDYMRKILHIFDIATSLIWPIYFFLIIIVVVFILMMTEVIPDQMIAISIVPFQLLWILAIAGLIKVKEKIESQFENN